MNLNHVNPSVYLYVAVLWGGYAFLHSFLVSIRFTDWLRGKTGRFYRLHRLTYNLFSAILLVLLFDYTHRLDQNWLIRFTGPWQIVQILLLMGSVIMMILAFFTYDPLEFLGIRQMVGLTGRGSTEQDNSTRISKHGILGVVRHPMYLATIIMMWSLNSGGVDILVHSILTVYILIGIQREEKKLVARFGRSYEEYQEQVPALIPFLNNFSDLF